MGVSKRDPTAMKNACIVALVLALCIGVATAAPSRNMRYSSGSGSTGSGTTTPEAKVITQVITLSVSAAQYTGNLKTVCETAYGIVLEIYDNSATPPAWHTGCSVSSSAARRSAQVTMIAQVSAAKAATADTKATQLSQTGGTTTFNNAVTSAKTALGSAFSSVTVSASGIAAPVSVPASQATTTTTSGASQLGLSIAAFAVLAAALRH